MEIASFRGLIERLERQAARGPAAYRARVAALATLGYAYILLMLGVLTALTVLIAVALRGAALKLVIPLVVVIGAVLEALWVRVPPPEGLRLTPQAVPSLFAMVRDVRGRVGAPRVHRILAQPELNAAIVQVPRLGVLGWQRNYLIVGLPLLQAVSPEEWRAILAHEMGHLSGSHGRFGAWIYRLRGTWGRLLERLERHESVVGKFLFGEFLRWYAPYFNAYTFVLARAHEYEADAAAAAVAGGETARRALMRVEVAGHQLHGFWEGLRAAASQVPEPPPDSQRRLRGALRLMPPTDDAAAWVAHAWHRPTDYSDTHPSLADRLRALGWRGDDAAGPPPPDPFAGPSAAEEYLGEAEKAIEDEFSRAWAGAVREPWQQEHAECTAARQRLAELDAAAAAGAAPETEWERILLYRRLGEGERAAAMAERLLARAPDHLGARFYVGALLLARGDPQGVEHVEQVMRRDPDAILEGCSALFNFHWSRGDVAAAERYRDLAEQRQEVLEQAERERSAITPQAQLQPHEFGSDAIAALREQLTRFPEVSEAYLARRGVQYAPETPCYVLGIVPHRRRWQRRDVKQETALRERIAQGVDFPIPLYVFLCTGDLHELRYKLGEVAGARVV